MEATLRLDGGQAAPVPRKVRESIGGKIRETGEREKGEYLIPRKLAPEHREGRNDEGPGLPSLASKFGR